VNVLFVGGTSDIAFAIARLHAERGDELCLLGRDAASLESCAGDLRVRGAGRTTTVVADALVPLAWDAAIERTLTADTFDRAYIAHSILPDEARARDDRALLREAFEVDATSAIAAIAAVAESFERRDSGRLVVFSTVATDRARSSVAVYGAAKAAVEYYANALALRWHGRARLGVTVVKPGRVATKMTAHLPRTLMSTRDRVARDAVAAADRGATVVYSPGYWAAIATVLRLVPRAVLAKLPI
jgi:short-subunit dehydrogenase